MRLHPSQSNVPVRVTPAGQCDGERYTNPGQISPATPEQMAPTSSSRHYDA